MLPIVLSSNPELLFLIHTYADLLLWLWILFHVT